MAAFTIFFCGTGSTSYDFANTNYHDGELISTLARHHTGHEFVDWMIVDGPGSGNLQEAEKWVTSPNYATWRGAAFGKGWEENVQHAIAVLLGVTQENRTTHTRGEQKMLRKMGVGVHTEPGRLFGTREVHDPLHARISPQALQQQKAKIFRQRSEIERVNLIGWSRGGVTCLMMANAMAQEPALQHLPINIFACDPVPGAGQFQTHRIRVDGNVHEYVAVYATDERSVGFTPVLATVPRAQMKFVTTIPGRHATLVGNASANGSSGFNSLHAPGRVTRDLAERYLQRWGTTLSKTLDLSDTAVLKGFDEMMARESVYRAMHDVSYTMMTQKGVRAVARGDGTFSDFNVEPDLRPDPLFVSLHHRLLFQQRYPALFRHVVEGVPMEPRRRAMELFNLKGMYPNLYRRWESLLRG